MFISTWKKLNIALKSVVPPVVAIF
jgi:hypothetical protein